MAMWRKNVRELFAHSDNALLSTRSRFFGYYFEVNQAAAMPSATHANAVVVRLAYESCGRDFFFAGFERFCVAASLPPFVLDKSATYGQNKTRRAIFGAVLVAAYWVLPRHVLPHGSRWTLPGFKC